MSWFCGVCLATVAIIIKNRKEVIAIEQTHFAIKIRQQELINDYDRLDEDQQRLAIRSKTREKM